MAFVSLTARAKERSTYVINAAFTDEYGGKVTPKTIKWSLVDGDDNVINGRNQVTLSPAQSVNIVLTGPDLALDASESVGISAKRFVVVEATYNSTYGTNLYMTDHVSFYIDNVRKV